MYECILWIKISIKRLFCIMLVTRWEVLKQREVSHVHVLSKLQVIYLIHAFYFIILRSIMTIVSIYLGTTLTT